MDVATLDLKRAVAVLRQHQAPTADEDLFAALGRVQMTTLCAWLLHEYCPERLSPDLLPSSFELSWMASGGDSEPLAIEQAGLEELGHLFPVIDQEEALLNMEPGERPMLVIDPQGFPLGYDDQYENMINPEYWPDHPLLMLAKYLDLCADEEYWALAQERFPAWPERMPRQARRGIPREFDFDKFLRRMRRIAPEPGYKVAFRIAAAETGNIFLDWDLEQAYTNAFEFDCKQIRWLARQWTQAQAMIEQWREAEDSVTTATLNKIILAWDASCAWIGQSQPGQPRTLVEVFEDEEDGGDD